MEDVSTHSENHDVLSTMIVGHTAAMQDILATVRRVAMYSTTTVLLQGESGTGKDVVARAIHQTSNRAAYPFVDINCAAIPDTLLETELFGVEAGAYTDAKASREGYLQRADGGTLFLDEIGSMPLALQAKLLRFLETRSFRRVGGTRELHVNLRVISATNVDLKAAVAHRTFREDLFYRLNVITIALPALRQRKDDIALLVAHFLQLHNANLPEHASPLRMSQEAMELLVRYHWPGNVRELRSVIQHGQILCDNNEILPRDLPLTIRIANSSASMHLQEMQRQIHLPPEGINLRLFLGNIERVLIHEALEQCNGNQVQAAQLLHISRDQLRYRLLNE